ncbi:MAG: hypothetical protein IJ128_07540, partial [Firmicutes bacterium]|nr:hypothetical protein [Bacillota bacterium]
IGFWACADCGRCFKDQEAQEEISKEDTIITPLGHIVVVTEETVTKPGCTAEGERHYVAKCTRCKETISESTVATPALGHNWGEWEVTEPTETEPGVKTRKCSRCDAAETKEVPVGECAHSSIIKVDKVEPGCEKQGKEEHYICEVCDALFWDAAGTQPIEDAGALGIPATGHTDRESYIAEKGEIAPTCTGTGSKLQLERCKTCGAILGLGKTVETDPLGHRWGNAEVVKPAGLDHYGLERYTCERCEETLSKPTPCTMDGAKLTLSRTAFVYNGQEQKPDIQSIGGKLFSEDVDYTAVWKDPSSLDVGAYTVTVSGKGEYTGTAKAGSYTIAPKGTSLKAPKKAKKAIKVKWKKQAEKMSKSRITGYQIMLATNSKFTKNKKTVKVKGYSKTSKKVKRLKGGKKYYIKIRTYMTVGGKTYYSAWSKVKKVKTKK